MRKILNIFIIIAIFMMGTVTCHATTNTFNRNELENYGVKKKWTIDNNNLDNILKTPAVDASEKIYDYSELLTVDDETELKTVIDSFIEKTNMDLVIVTTNFSYYDEKENEEYASDFYDYNDFGMNVKNNSGILFLRNSNPSDPYYNIYTFGDAQLYFNQNRYDSILDGIYINISSGDYLNGFKSFIMQTENYISQGIPEEMKDYYVDDMGYLKYAPPPKVYKIPWPIVLGISLLITLIIIPILIKKNKMVYNATFAEEYLNRKSININNRKDILVNSHTSSHTISSSNDSMSSSGGGFSSSSGSSGGGHSSGGGRHG